MFLGIGKKIDVEQKTKFQVHCFGTMENMSLLMYDITASKLKFKQYCTRMDRR